MASSEKRPPPPLLNKYGMVWPAHFRTPLDIEFHMIRAKGYVTLNGQRYGNGLFFHYREAMSLLWPDDDHHRWSDLCLRRIVQHEITVILGASDSNKTYVTSRFILTDWWAHWENTLWMVSSTELRGAELRIWGKLKELFNRARALYPELPGTVLESKHAITSEEITDDGSEGRLFTKGIIFIPCKTGAQWIGLGAYAGIKPTKNGRLAHAGDECSFMERSFLDAYANWFGKENFRGILQGNPIDLEDPLCLAAEPETGWDTWQDTKKTQEWASRWYNAWVIALDGRDSPNLDLPGKARYPYLIGRKKLEAVAATEGPDSPLFWMQCVGKPRPGAEKLKVITRQICELGRAFEDVIWEGSPLTDVVSLDAAYGGEGGDRCVLTRSKFGRDVDGGQVIMFYPWVNVPVSVRNPEPPEDQIARFCMQYCFGFGISPEQFFFDGRSTLAMAFARIWSSMVNVVDFGGPATDRPVSADEYVWEGDQQQTRRLKKCCEHYSKFVTELWFSVRYAIVGRQVRNLPRDVAEEGWKRQWHYTKTAPPRIEVETKKDMKTRTTRSPDLFDSLVTNLEGARRLGFVIQNLKEPQAGGNEPEDYLEAELAKHRAFVKKSELTYD